MIGSRLISKIRIKLQKGKSEYAIGEELDILNTAKKYRHDQIDMD